MMPQRSNPHDKVLVRRYRLRINTRFQHRTRLARMNKKDWQICMRMILDQNELMRIKWK